MLYLNSKDFGCRPSQMLALDDPYAALCLDSACGQFGRALESAMNGVTGKTEKARENKRERVLHTWLGIPLKYQNPTIGASKKKKP